MGLDGYLYCNSKALTKRVREDYDLRLMWDDGNDGLVGYWRKAEQIHNWFVQEAQHGYDNCDPHFVTPKMLIELRDTCKDILANCEPVGEGSAITNSAYAYARLPFKLTYFEEDYDIIYICDLEYTVHLIDFILSQCDVNDDVMTLKDDPAWHLRFVYESSR